MTRDVSDITQRKPGLLFEKSQLVESCRPKKKGDFRLQTYKTVTPKQASSNSSYVIPFTFRVIPLKKA